MKDLAASRAFYEKLGFETFGGDPAQHWLIMKNGDAAIGLFQGMFESNILTFNPGWDANASNLDSYVDVREIQRRLRAQGLEFVSEADEATTGPAIFVVVDPDGNAILIDQHVRLGAGTTIGPCSLRQNGQAEPPPGHSSARNRADPPIPWSGGTSTPCGPHAKAALHHLWGQVAVLQASRDQSTEGKLSRTV